MTPTPKLRFVERQIMEFPDRLLAATPITKTVRILQQWWEKDASSKYTSAIAGAFYGEWRDVPLEKEQA